MATVTDPAILYHYTTQEGFLGIIRDKKLWATSIRHLNDAGELAYAIGIARSIVKQEEDLLSSQFSETFNRVLESASAEEFYVGSFSAESDLLSQWRAYSRQGVGFSIGFDRMRLADLALGQGFSLNPCSYDRKKHIKAVGTAMKVLFEDPDPESVLWNDTEFITGFLEMAPTMKHPAFQEEGEWRIVSQRSPDSQPIILYRPGKSLLIPYQEFGLDADNVRALIRRVVVGPSPHLALAVKTATEFLQAAGFEGVEVAQSEVPYRSW